jgi:hypothetical protein
MLDRSHVRTRFSPPLLDPKTSAVFLDLDGTIAEIAARPDSVGAAYRARRPASSAGSGSLLSADCVRKPSALSARRPNASPVLPVAGASRLDGERSMHARSRQRRHAVRGHCYGLG